MDNRIFPTATAIVTVLALTSAACGQPASEESGAADRKERIVENLKLEFKQLREGRLVVGELADSGIPGLDQGTLTVNGQNAFRFLVTEDDSRLYLIAAGPVDVRPTLEETARALEEERRKESLDAVARSRELLAETSGRPARGSADAPITIVEFSDFQCPYCARAAQTLRQVMAKYPEDVRLVYLHLPLPNHPWAEPAAVASECASQQSHDAFWTLHDYYFEYQRQINPGNVLARSQAALSSSGIDLEVWSECAENTSSAAHQRALSVVSAEAVRGQRLGVSGTPGFFVNGRFLDGARPLATFDELIAKAREDLSVEE